MSEWLIFSGDTMTIHIRNGYVKASDYQIMAEARREGFTVKIKDEWR